MVGSKCIAAAVGYERRLEQRSLLRRLGAAWEEVQEVPYGVNVAEEDAEVGGTFACIACHCRARAQLITW